MNTVEQLNRKFARQDFSQEPLYTDELKRFIEIARNYAELENMVSVLSDLRTNKSYIFYGKFSKVLGLKQDSQTETLYSIWEDNILNKVHPDDLKQKYIQELYFFDFVRQQPKDKRNNYHLIHKIRMKNRTGNYIYVLHRTLYIYSPKSKDIWLALCLYGPAWDTGLCENIILNTSNGETLKLNQLKAEGILSEREKQILNYIGKGMISKDIAAALSISKNTVSRHRQEILKKLQVRNSIEAYNIAKELNII